MAPVRRILVYAFGPYEEFADNVSEAVIARLRPRLGLATEVFAVRFDRAMFLRTLQRHRPDIVIGLGQHRTGRKLRLERKAVNRFGHRGGPWRQISPSGPPACFADLRLPETAATRVTCDAGTYVCNFSMYLTLEYCRRRGCRFAFVHIPRHGDIRAVAAYLRYAIRTLGARQLDGAPGRGRSHRAGRCR
jgi:pyrrolidone-carboxylate peptidase